MIYLVRRNAFFIVCVVVMALFATASFVFAEEEAFFADKERKDKIEVLQKKLSELKAEISKIQDEIKILRGDSDKPRKITREEFKISRSLSLGTSGEDVKQLQEFLRQFPDIYPEGVVTGFFGLLTEGAVKRFQAKYNIEQAGVVGPKTKTMIKLFFDEDEIRIDVVQKIKPGGINSTGTSTNGTSTPGGLGNIKMTFCHKPSSEGGRTITVAAPSAKAHLDHGDTIGRCTKEKKGGDDDDDDNTGTTTPDIIPPLISNVSATNTTASSTKITWVTNEVANSTVWYSSTNPVDTQATGTPFVTTAVLTTTHEHILTLLASSTTFYFVVESKDHSGNEAKSIQHSFITLAE